MRPLGDKPPNKRAIKRSSFHSLTLAAGALLQSLSAEPIELFLEPEPARDWAIVNDTVMGGVSSSRMDTTEEGNLLFRGTLSLENNGGFASVRSRQTEFSLRNQDTLQLRVRGDGRTYYLDLRPRSMGAAGSFRASFPTVAGEWQDILIPASRFVAQSFGRPNPSIAFDPRAMRSIGFTLSDKQPGPFQLEIESVSIVPDDNAPDPLETIPPIKSPQPLELIDLAIARGVPLFNRGEPEACAAIYEVTCLALVALPSTPESLSSRLQQAIAEARLASDPRERAWLLRYALDDARQSAL